MNNPSQEQISEIGIAVFEQAEEIFEACGAASDFAHQGRLVFGSVNRIMLTTRGWVADEPYCNPDFLARFKAHIGGI